jgi:hypothetical protein
MPVFGWFYPPGVTEGMICTPDPPCELCGEAPEECGCPECPECSAVGCVQHEEELHLRRRFERLEYLVRCAKRELERRGMPIYPEEPGIAPPDSDVDPDRIAL